MNVMTFIYELLSVKKLKFLYKLSKEKKKAQIITNGTIKTPRNLNSNVNIIFNLSQKELNEPSHCSLTSSVLVIISKIKTLLRINIKPCGFTYDL
jgi:hypothetical protein